MANLNHFLVVVLMMVVSSVSSFRLGSNAQPAMFRGRSMQMNKVKRTDLRNIAVIGRLSQS